MTIAFNCIPCFSFNMLQKNQNLIDISIDFILLEKFPKFSTGARISKWMKCYLCE